MHTHRKRVCIAERARVFLESMPCWGWSRHMAHTCALVSDAACRTRPLLCRRSLFAAVIRIWQCLRPEGHGWHTLPRLDGWLHHNPLINWVCLTYSPAGMWSQMLCDTSLLVVQWCANCIHLFLYFWGVFFYMSQLQWTYLCQVTQIFNIRHAVHFLWQMDSIFNCHLIPPVFVSGGRGGAFRGYCGSDWALLEEEQLRTERIVLRWTILGSTFTFALSHVCAYEMSTTGVALFFQQPYGLVILRHEQTKFEKGHKAEMFVVQRCPVCMGCGFVVPLVCLNICAVSQATEGSV